MYKRMAMCLLVLAGMCLLFECGLFCAGKFLLFQRRSGTRGEIPIVCIGDSHTFGVGTSARYSYPAQAEALLNLNNVNKKFSVVNLGIPGSSTRRQAEELRVYLRDHDARIVFWLTGRNNQYDLQQLADPSRYSGPAGYFNSLRIVKFWKALCGRMFMNGQGDKDDTAAAEYLDFYLGKTDRLCREKGSRLILLSYYDSSDGTVEKVAHAHGIPYFDLTKDCAPLFDTQEGQRFVSPDCSHLNRMGYKLFAEQLYERLFLAQACAGVQIGPLLERLTDRDLYTDPAEQQRMIKLQQERIARKSGSSEYPFELVHLGHMYVEAANSAAAIECYRQALVSSGYSENNTITAPLINWYLRQGRKDEALRLCEEILLHNPGNRIAQEYWGYLSDGKH